MSSKNSSIDEINEMTAQSMWEELQDNIALTAACHSSLAELLKTVTCLSDDQTLFAFFDYSTTLVGAIRRCRTDAAAYEQYKIEKKVKGEYEN